LPVLLQRQTCITWPVKKSFGGSAKKRRAHGPDLRPHDEGQAALLRGVRDLAGAQSQLFTCSLSERSAMNLSCLGSGWMESNAIP
jgi:hypothetical protein